MPVAIDYQLAHLHGRDGVMYLVLAAEPALQTYDPSDS